MTALRRTPRPSSKPQIAPAVVIRVAGGDPRRGGALVRLLLNEADDRWKWWRNRRDEPVRFGFILPAQSSVPIQVGQRVRFDTSTGQVVP